MGTRRCDAYTVSRRKQGAWRTASLCAQVRRALETAFAFLADERLESVFVEEVSPAPNASRLLVVLRCFVEAEIDLEETRAALAGAEGLLRTEVAVAIHRKRTPHLHYVLLASGEWDERDGGERAEATE